MTIRQPLSGGISVLFVNQYYRPDVASTGQHLADLAEHLAGAGVDVTVWCGRGRYVSESVRAPTAERREGVAIRRLAAPGAHRSRHAARLTSYALFYAQVFARLLFSRSRFSGIVFLTTPPLLGFIGYCVRRLRGQRYAIWSMDLHPEAEFAAGVFREHGLVGGLSSRLARLGYHGADFIVFLGPYMLERFRRSYTAPGREVIVPVWGRVEDCTVEGDNPLTPEYNPDDRLVVAYSGNAGLAHRFDEILEAIARLASDGRFRFLFAGDGPRRPAIERFMAERGIKNFNYLPYFRRRDVRHWLSMPDVHLASLRPEFAGISVPGKLYGIMAAARPVLFVGPTASETAETIRNARCGEVIDPEAIRDPVGEIVRKLEAWARNRSDRLNCGRNGRDAFLNDFEKGRCCSRLEAAIRHHWEPSNRERTT